jgi:hypothetical protein
MIKENGINLKVIIIRYYKTRKSSIGLLLEKAEEWTITLQLKVREI